MNKRAEIQGVSTGMDEHTRQGVTSSCSILIMNPTRPDPEGESSPSNTDDTPRMESPALKAKDPRLMTPTKSISPLPRSPASPNPRPKKDVMRSDERQKLAKERREEKAKYLEELGQLQAAKKNQWLEKEDKARQLREQQLEDRRRKLEDQRIKAEKRRAALEERQKQKLEKNKERYEAAIQRSTKRTWAEIRQQRSSLGNAYNQNSNQKETRSIALSPWESSIVDRLMTPTLSFLARSRSAASVLNTNKDGHSPLCPRSVSASPLTLCSHQPHHRCSDRWRVTSSTPDILQRPQRRSSTPMDKNRKEKKDKERENEMEKSAITQERVFKKRQSMPSLRHRPDPSPSPLSRHRPASPATLRGRTGSPSPAASPKPPPKQGSPSTPKARPKRARTPARIIPRTSSPVPLERVRATHRPATPERRKSSPVVSVVTSSTATTPSSNATMASSVASPSPELVHLAAPVRAASPASSPSPKPMAGTNDPEEAARILAEKRRQAREQRERDEQERREQEDKERILKEERVAREAGERHRREEEARAMAEEQQRRDEEQRLLEEKEAQERAKAEQEENLRLQKQKEEAEARAREEAEKQRLEREKHFQKEEQERLERKKRLDEIMKRTRRTDGGDKKETKPSPLTEDKQAESSKAAADSQSQPEIILPNKKMENGQSNVRESSISVPLVNGVLPAKHENGVSAKGDPAHFEGIISLTNHGNGSREKSESSTASEPILTFESEDSFMKKAGAIKPQHVAEVL